MGASLLPASGIFTVGIDALLALTTALYLLKLLVVDLMGGPAGVKGFLEKQVLGAGVLKSSVFGLEAFSSGSGVCGPVLCEVGEKRSLLHQNVSRRAW